MNRNQTHQAEPFSSFMLEFSLMLGERATKEIYSSDFAMQFALAARGWHIEPWEETAQMEPRSSFSERFFLSVLFFSSLCFTKVCSPVKVFQLRFPTCHVKTLPWRSWNIHGEVVCVQHGPSEDKQKDVPLTGPKDAAFRHYCSCYPGGKPTYNIKLKTLGCKVNKNMWKIMFRFSGTPLFPGWPCMDTRTHTQVSYLTICI